jgi:hypothetical protein
MIRIARRPRSAVVAWQAGFLAMLPDIRTHARIAFRDLAPEAREEAVQEAVCNAMVAYARLCRLGKADLAYPGVLARFAVAQTRDFRKVGGRLNVKDVSSGYCQCRKGVVVERLDKFDAEEGGWIEAVVEDRRTPVPEQAAFRCDFPAWLATLPRRNRRIAQALSVGHTTGELAKRFKVSAGRISQLRREFQKSWEEFHGEALPDTEAA